MEVKINNLKIAYDCDGEGENIILLHGWGANRYTWDKVYKHLIKNYKVYRFDLPGFGDSPEPEEAISIDELGDILNELCIRIKIDNPIILGHSYGGRIAIKYASKYNLKKLILVDSAGIKHKVKFKNRFKIRLYKILKKLHINVKMGSSDYKQASPVMKSMIVKAINDDLTSILEKIKVPTLIIWGENDTATPLNDAKILNEKIKNSGLVVIDKVGHFPYIENYQYFIIVLDSFLGYDEK